MHDAGEKDTPPSDRLVVARKPLLPAPYARFYSSTRFRSVSRARHRFFIVFETLRNSDPSAISVAPPLPAASRFLGNPFTDRGLDRNDARKLAPIIRPSDRSSSCRRPTYALIDPSSSSRLGRSVDYDYIRRFNQIFFFFGRILIDWSITLSLINEEWTKSARFFEGFSLGFRKNSSLERRFNACG